MVCLSCDKNNKVYCKGKCKYCYLKEYRKLNRDALNQKNREYYYKNRISLLQKKAQYLEQNREKCNLACKISYYRYKEERLLSKKIYYETNKDLILEYKKTYSKTKVAKANKRRVSAERRALKSKACPSWVNKNELKNIYANCPYGYEVDHIIPLKHKDVCGLHVPWNLQYLPKAENSRKNNKFDGTYDNNSWRLTYEQKNIFRHRRSSGARN